MRWKHWRRIYQPQTAAYAKHLIEQHERHIFAVSCLDEAPGYSRQEKLAWLLHNKQDEIYGVKSRSVLHRMRRIRDIEIQRALRWWNRRYPVMSGEQE